MDKRKKFCLIILGNLVLLLIIFLLPQNKTKLTAAPTLANTVLTNIATITWSSGSLAVTNFTNVGTNYGVSWVGEANKNVIAGSRTSNVTTITNDGNCALGYVINLVSSNGDATKIWTVKVSNSTDGGAESTLPYTVNNISPAGVKTIVIYVDVPSDEANGKYTEYKFIASNSLAVSANATYYTGHNNVVYGGFMGRFGAPAGSTYLSNAQDVNPTNWKVTVQAGTMLLAKTITIENVAPYSSVTDPVPGALLTFKLAYSNAGSATANNVRIIDEFPTNYVTFMTNSLRSNTYEGSYGGTTLTSSDDGDPGMYTNDQKVFFAPFADAKGPGGTVNQNASGAFFYQATLN